MVRPALRGGSSPCLSCWWPQHPPVTPIKRDHLRHRQTCIGLPRAPNGLLHRPNGRRPLAHHRAGPPISHPAGRIQGTGPVPETRLRPLLASDEASILAPLTTGHFPTWSVPEPDPHTKPAPRGSSPLTLRKPWTPKRHSRRRARNVTRGPSTAATRRSIRSRKLHQSPYPGTKGCKIHTSESSADCPIRNQVPSISTVPWRPRGPKGPTGVPFGRR
jgi:hypothetical protein